MEKKFDTSTKLLITLIITIMVGVIGLAIYFPLKEASIPTLEELEEQQAAEANIASTASDLTPYSNFTDWADNYNLELVYWILAGTNNYSDDDIYKTCYLGFTSDNIYSQAAGYWHKVTLTEDNEYSASAGTYYETTLSCGYWDSKPNLLFWTWYNDSAYTRAYYRYVQKTVDGYNSVSIIVGESLGESALQLLILDKSDYSKFDQTISFYDSVGGSLIRTAVADNRPCVYSDEYPEGIAYDSIRSFDDPTKKGYTFKGWCLDEGYKVPFNWDNIKKGNYNVYAKWEVNSYTLRVYNNFVTGLESVLPPCYFKDYSIDYGTELNTADFRSTYEDYLENIAFPVDPNTYYRHTYWIAQSDMFDGLVYNCDQNFNMPAMDSMIGFCYYIPGIESDSSNPYQTYNGLTYEKIGDEYSKLSQSECFTSYYESNLNISEAKTLETTIRVFNPIAKAYSDEPITFVYFDSDTLDGQPMWLSWFVFSCYDTGSEWKYPMARYSSSLTNGYTSSSDWVIRSDKWFAGSKYDFGGEVVCLALNPSAVYNDETVLYNLSLVDISEPTTVYKVEYDLNGGSLIYNYEPSKMAYISNGYLVYDTKLDNNIIKTNYYFSGWYLDEACTIEANAENVQEKYNGGDTIILYADYGRSYRNINYVVDGYGHTAHHIYKTVTTYYGDFSAPINLSWALERDRTEAQLYTTSFSFGLLDIYTLNKYVFLGWSKTQTSSEQWKTYTTERHCALVDSTYQINENSSDTLYAVFALQSQNTKADFWAWDNTDLYVVEVDDTLPDRMLEEANDIDEDQCGVYYCVLYDYDGNGVETRIFDSQIVDIGKDFQIVNDDTFTANIKLVLTDWRYRLIGWSTTPTTVNIWDSITCADDFKNVELVTNPYQVSGSTTLYAVCCLESVYSTVIKDYDIWNEEDGLTIDDDIKQIAGDVWNAVKDFALDSWAWLKEGWQWLKWIVIAAAVIFIVIIAIKIAR